MAIGAAVVGERVTLAIGGAVWPVVESAAGSWNRRPVRGIHARLARAGRAWD
jgi:hypothetical protein